MPIKDYIPPKNAIFLSLATMLFGIGGGFFTGQYFASKEFEARKAEAVAEATVRAAADAKERALNDFEETAPERLREMFPTVFNEFGTASWESGYAKGKEDGLAEQVNNVREESYNEGYKVGFDEANAARVEELKEVESAAFDRGIQVGESRQITFIERMSLAEEDWARYATLIEGLANAASRLQEEPESSGAQQELISSAIATLQVSSDLKEAYQEQASAFNSIMDDIGAAVEARNYPRLRELCLALRNALEARGGLFIGGYKKSVEILDSLSN